MKKNYKIFGKINIIDFLVVLILILAVLFGIYKVKGVLSSDNDVKIRFTFSSKEVSNFVIEKIEENCCICDDTNKSELGRCTSIEVSDSLSSIITDEGEWITTGKPDYSSLVLQSETTGKKLKNGVEIAGNDYLVGDFVVMRAGIAKVYIEITGIEIID